MVKNKKEVECRRVNLRESSVNEKITISPDQIPTLIPNLQNWQKGDTDPYYKLQKIAYPIVANGLIYEESFFESYLNNLKDRPFPGSKAGHSIFWGERSKTDFLLVGGMLEKNGDGTGYAFLKTYIPKEGDSGSNETFILENKSNMVHYSLVSYPREIIENDADGNRIVRVVESMYGERNDAVDYGTGAMKQVTNTVSTSYSSSVKIIDSEWSKSASERRWRNHAGISDAEDLPNQTYSKRFAWRDAENDDNFGAYKLPHWDYIGGAEVVNIRAVRNILARLSQTQGPSDAEKSSIENMMNKYLDRYDEQRQNSNNYYLENKMEKEEILIKLCNMKKNGEISVDEVITRLGVKNMLITDDHKNALAVINKLKESGVDDPIKYIEGMKAEIDRNIKQVFNARMTELYGAPHSDEKPNLIRNYAEKMLTGKSGDEFEKQVETLKEDPIMKNFAADLADVNSQQNIIVGRVENKDGAAVKGDAILADY